MAQTGFTPIILYHSTTASATPSAGNLVDGELALNTVDEKLYFKNSSGVVKLLASNAGALGSVTSVSQTFTGGLISVSGSPITSSGTLALTVAGTSGGIPYFSSSSTWASSAALAANSLVIGGGAGVAPSTIATGTNVLTALGVNVGTTGAFVVNGGALGTPSSGTLTNVSGLPLSTGVTGTLAVGNGGTGQTTYTDGQLLIGNSTGNTLTKATLTAGTGISITNGSGSISISNTGVTSVGGAGTVNGITLTGTVTSSGSLTLGGTLSGVSLTTQVTGTLPVGNGGTGVTSSTGSGSVVLSTSPTLTTPNLGTPASVTLTNATGLPLSTGVTGTLSVANGGTGQTTYTDGQLLIGNTSGNTLTKATLTAGSGVSITNGNGSITISSTGSGGTVTSVGGTGTVNGITLTGTVTSSGNLTLGGTLSGVSLTTQVTGTLPVANGGTGQTTYTDGQLLIGNSTGNTLTKATLTAGSGISITNGNGSITIATTGGGGTVTSVSGTGTVNGITLTGTVTSSGSLTLGGTLSGVSLTTQVTGTLPVANGGTGVTSSTGSGAVVLSTSPTLTTPNLGTPSAATLTNATGLPLTTGVTGTLPIANGGTGSTATAYCSLTTNVTGTLPVANGGTGVTSSTGTGAVVLSTSPALTTPNLGTPSAATLTNATGLPLTTGVTGTLPVANGGTGATSLTANNVLLGNGTSAPQTVAPGTSGNVLSSNGTTWASSALTATQVSNAYAGLTAGAVGTMAMLEWTAGSGTVAFGGTASSADLLPSNAAGGNNGSVSGTWRCLGFADADSGVSDKITLWVRTV